MQIDLQRELEQVCKGMEWDIEGLLHTDKRVSPIPAESRVVTEIFQSLIIQNLEAWAKKHDLKLTDNAEFARDYQTRRLSWTGIEWQSTSSLPVSKREIRCPA